jgi:hypothetical protein
MLRDTTFLQATQWEYGRKKERRDIKKGRDCTTNYSDTEERSVTELHS